VRALRSLNPVGGVFEGYLNEYNSAGWSSSTKQNYGPVAARYVKLHNFDFRVRFSRVITVVSHLLILMVCAGQQRPSQHARGDDWQYPV
jgi:hypothetical protein